jgi:hypothetical protein
MPALIEQQSSQSDRDQGPGVVVVALLAGPRPMQDDDTATNLTCGQPQRKREPLPSPAANRERRMHGPHEPAHAAIMA